MPDSVEKRLSALDVVLPTISKPAGNLVGWKSDEGLIYVSGQLPLDNGVVAFRGRVGETISKESGYVAARLAALNVIGQLSAAVGGDLSRIEQFVKVSGFVCCTSEFLDIGAVVDGASDLFVDVFGERGRHARFAIGVMALPRGVPVEIEAVVRVRR